MSVGLLGVSLGLIHPLLTLHLSCVHPLVENSSIMRYSLRRVSSDYPEASQGMSEKGKILMSHDNSQGEGRNLVSQTIGRRRMS